MKKFCPKCKKEYSDKSDEFCAECGTKLISQPDSNPEPTTSNISAPLIKNEDPQEVADEALHRRSQRSSHCEKTPDSLVKKCSTPAVSKKARLGYIIALLVIVIIAIAAFFFFRSDSRQDKSAKAPQVTQTKKHSAKTSSKNKATDKPKDKVKPLDASELVNGPLNAASVFVYGARHGIYTGYIIKAVEHKETLYCYMKPNDTTANGWNIDQSGSNNVVYAFSVPGVSGSKLDFYTLTPDDTTELYQTTKSNLQDGSLDPKTTISREDMVDDLNDDNMAKQVREIAKHIVVKKGDPCDSDNPAI